MSVKAQWAPTNGPEGTYVHAAAAQRGVLFAGTESGIFVSTNQGELWTYLDATASFGGIEALASSEGHLYARTWGSVYASADGGTSWSRIYSTARGKPSVTSLALVGDTALVLLDSTTLLRTRDGGSSWDSVGRSWTSPIHSLTGDGKRVFALCTDSTSAVSSDAGRSWLVQNHHLPSPPGTLIAMDSMFFYGSRNGIFRSLDLVHWSPCNAGYAPDTVAWGLWAAGDFLFACSRSGLFRSSDHGSAWSRIRGQSPYAGSGVFDCIVQQGETLYAGCGYGVFVSSDWGKTWQWRGHGLGKADGGFVSGVRFRDSQQALFSAWAGGGLFASLDLGASWVLADSGIDGATVHDVVPWGDTLFALLSDGVLRSTDRGASWHPADSGLTAVSYEGYLVSMGDVLFYGSIFDPALYRSTNGGALWIRIPADPGWFGFNGLMSVGTKLLAGTSSGELVYSPDSGAHWQMARWPNPWDSSNTVPMVAFAQLGTRTFVSTSISYGIPGLVYGSSDSGASYVLTIPPGGETVGGNIMGLLAEGKVLFANSTSYRRTVCLSRDSGATWLPVSEGLPDPSHYGSSQRPLSSVGGNLFVITTDGVWRRPMSELVTDSAPVGSPGSPGAFRLEQNYPNPFNPSTTIRYSLPHRSHVTLTVFNTLGQKVRDIVNGDIDAGYHEIRFNADDLASGLYFYRLQAGGAVDVRKLLLVK